MEAAVNSEVPFREYQFILNSRLVFSPLCSSAQHWSSLDGSECTALSGLRGGRIVSANPEPEGPLPSLLALHLLCIWATPPNPQAEDVGGMLESHWSDRAGWQGF